MKFKFNQYGFIDNGEVELGDLTIICGPNNVGKTYVSYGIYGFLKHFRELVEIPISSEQIEILKNDGSLNINLEDYQTKINDYFKQASQKFTQGLTNYFNAPDDFFKNTIIDFTYKHFHNNLNFGFKQTTKFGQNRSLTLLFDKAPNESILSIALQVGEQEKQETKLSSRIIGDIVGNVVSNCLFENMFLKAFIATSERTTISLFYKELDISRNAILEHLYKNDKPNDDPIALLNSMRSRYARPIQDNIGVIRDYENLSKRKSFIRANRQKYKPIFDALQSILDGSFKNIDGNIYYQPRKERNRDRVIIPLYLTSSAVKTLFLIDLYINCLAEPHGILIIDEPELNLHPDNQRKMASLLARLVNAGVKVLITTHSDYLIREINNKIMLNSQIENKQSIMQNAKIVEQDVLRPEQVKAYAVKTDHTIKIVPVDRYGINMEIFDDIIADANKLADDLFYGMPE
ncbi:AAA family ATPase [Candidatus Albibeggiatoa sp. nov. BB20]|uniref:AAA family ATPase n=1 Tax=Candidatus Albibeggiatoa sp. nov. BB20 TaxID=3162723 RepID=UPI00336535E4